MHETHAKYVRVESSVNGAGTYIHKMWWDLWQLGTALIMCMKIVAHVLS